jgi:FHS family L-fucose permease-like MFS transporter
MNDRPRGMFQGEDGRSLVFTFCLVSSLFLLWGFCSGLIDVMDKHFQESLHLSLSQSAWVQFAHYLGYFLMALPAGLLAQRLGYKGAIIAGLLIVAAGGFWFLAATRIALFWAFLLGVCLIASGLAFLETVANPYSSVLGAQRYAAARINLAQSCNGLGWILGPIAGSFFFYSVDASGTSTGTQNLHIPNVAVGIVVLILAGIFALAPVPDIKVTPTYPPAGVAGDDRRPLWSHPHFSMAVVAQFLYVAAQAGIFSFFINYMTSDVPAVPAGWPVAMNKLAQHAGILQPWLFGWYRRDASGSFGISDKGAANLASFAFGCFLIGRVSGAALLRRLAAHKVLAAYNATNVLLTLLVFARLGWLSVACVFLSYFFMSITFPTIFALGIHGLGERTKRASAYIVMAVTGGAILPKFMGLVADHFGVGRSFIVPSACFLIVAYYGMRWPRYSGCEDLHQQAVRQVL